MRIVLAGSSGLIGSALKKELVEAGHEVRVLVRREPTDSTEKRWNPAAGELDPAHIKDADAIVSLGGVSVGRLPWTRGYKKKLRDSRLQPTETIAKTLLALGEGRVPAFISASASGFYGSEPGTVFTEKDGHAGDIYLARLCVAWEAAALQAASVTRVALLRTGPVLDHRGVLKPMILLTKLGFAGPLGRGEQVWPWISLRDEVRAIRHVIENDISGPVNLAAPVVSTANDIGRALARKMRRPFWLPAPAFALRILLGRDAADSLILCDARLEPRVLLETGFEFLDAGDVQDAIS